MSRSTRKTIGVEIWAGLVYVSNTMFDSAQTALRTNENRIDYFAFEKWWNKTFQSEEEKEAEMEKMSKGGAALSKEVKAVGGVA